MGDVKTKELERMLDDPKNAILTMSVPLFVGFLISNFQYFIDSYWCSGLGTEAMSAITVAGPIYWLTVDVGVGLGVGVSTAMARALGADNRKRAESLATQIIVFASLISILLAVSILVISGPLMRYMANSDDISLSMEYMMPYIAFSLPITLNGIMLGMIRGEGAAKKSTTASVLSSVVNIILDPIFIYTMGWGIAGAALATCIAYTSTTLLIVYWYATDKMYVRVRFKGYRFDREQLWDIMVVGIPNMLEMILMPLMIIPENAIVMKTGGDMGLVCANLPFRVISIVSIPIDALATAMVSVASAMVGQRNYERAMMCYRFTMKVSLTISFVSSFILLIFSEWLMLPFSSKGDMVEYHDELVKVLRINSFSTFLCTFQRMGSSVMQTLRFAHLATLSVFLREALFLGFYYWASFYGMDAIYCSMMVVNFICAILMMILTRYAINARKYEYFDMRPPGSSA